MDNRNLLFSPMGHPLSPADYAQQLKTKLSLKILIMLLPNTWNIFHFGVNLLN